MRIEAIDIQSFRLSFEWIDHWNPKSRERYVEPLTTLYISVTSRGPEFFEFLNTGDKIMEINHPRLQGKWHVQNVDIPRDYPWINMSLVECPRGPKEENEEKSVVAIGGLDVSDCRIVKVEEKNNDKEKEEGRP